MQSGKHKSITLRFIYYFRHAHVNQTEYGWTITCETYCHFNTCGQFDVILNSWTSQRMQGWLIRCTCSLNTVGPYPVHIMNSPWGFSSICDVLPVRMKQFALWSVHVIQLPESCSIQHFPIDHDLTHFTPRRLRSWRFCRSALTSGSRKCSVHLHNDLFLFRINCSKVLSICCAN